jgi:hypothetical protein
MNDSVWECALQMQEWYPHHTERIKKISADLAI